MSKVLIFGAGGFVGRYLALEFKNAGYEVAGSDRVRTESVPEFVSFTEADLLEAAQVSKVVAEAKRHYCEPCCNQQCRCILVHAGSYYLGKCSWRVECL